MLLFYAEVSSWYCLIGFLLASTISFVSFFTSCCEQTLRLLTRIILVSFTYFRGRRAASTPCCRYLICSASVEYSFLSRNRSKGSPFWFNGNSQSCAVLFENGSNKDVNAVACEL
ncbi:hypothetical protein LIER_32106 [Lithospermum erythrorhizon]|uniref:Uncharacterized protein n=1 Tax=Lithospermum erythrorhizon TaxID=34254 RepID=A0AAV3RSZ1_LITER